jgi:hypothetical protein
LRPSEVVIVALTAIILVESAFIGMVYVRATATSSTNYVAGKPETSSFPFEVFNQSVSNNTDHEFVSSYNGSWVVTIRSWLAVRHPSGADEAQMAFAPSYPVEGQSIPTIIVQERADGLLRIEYFAQAWANTYGLVLYNSTSIDWRGGVNVTLRFIEFGEPSSINPQIAPRANGNLSVTIGSNTVVSDYPIAWASLGEVYLYGLSGTSFFSGIVTIAVQSLTRA